MKLLITGAGGFIGSHLAEQCVIEGFNIRVLFRYNSRNSFGWLENSIYRKEIEVTFGDIRDFDSVVRAMEGCQGVFHLAALIGIPYSYVSPLAYIKTNVEGTYNVLEAARILHLENILVTSTSETYGTAQYIPMDERHPLIGQSPYSASKIAADQLAISYHKAFDLPVKIVRPFNTFGPRQSARAVIPTIITQIVSRHDEVRLGNLNPTRDLTYILDTVQGFLEIWKSKTLYGEIVNIGMNEEISVSDLAGMIARLLKKEIRILQDSDRVRPAQSEVDRLRCDNTKILAHTNWKPRYNLEKGLKETIEWISENRALYKPEIYNV